MPRAGFGRSLDGPLASPWVGLWAALGWPWVWALAGFWRVSGGLGGFLAALAGFWRPWRASAGPGLATAGSGLATAGSPGLATAGSPGLATAGSPGLGRGGSGARMRRRLPGPGCGRVSRRPAEDHDHYDAYPELACAKQLRRESDMSPRRQRADDYDNGETLGLAPFGTRGYAVGESSIWSLWARCDQMKVLA
jgi:hypothetical protein